MTTPSAVRAPRSDELTVASFNVQRFFNDVNDPGITEPVLQSAVFTARLVKASLIVRTMLRSPDIIGLQEVENLATLQALANRINADVVAGGADDPGYVAYLEEGNDIGGIDVGFLVKASRVSVIDVVQEGRTATFVNPDTGALEVLNDRPPLVLRATAPRPGGAPFPLTVIVNHLRSLVSVDDPVDGHRVRSKRRAQAEFLANLIQARQSADPGERLISIGDYNAFQFNDGYVDVMGTIKGQPAPAPAVTLASADLVDPDLVDLVDLIPPADRYSYVFRGSAQVLDHALVGRALLPFLSAGGVQFARVDADFAEAEDVGEHRPFFGRECAGGTVIAFEIAGGKAGAFRFMNALDLVLISNNLGDSKSLATHPATTTHQRLTPAARLAQGIPDGMVRLSVGLEDVADLEADLAQALRAV